MGATNIILQLIEENNGIAAISVISAAGISRGDLNYPVDTGRLEKTPCGVYIPSEAWEDEFINLQNRFERGVFFRETALSLYDLTDRTPNRYDMTFSSHYNLTSAKKENVGYTRATELLFEIGTELAYIPNGDTVHTYSLERTLCDVLRPRSHVGIQVVAEAFKSYTKQKSKNIPHLPGYVRLPKVKERLGHYLEVLL